MSVKFLAGIVLSELPFDGYFLMIALIGPGMRVFRQGVDIAKPTV